MLVLAIDAVIALTEVASEEDGEEPAELPVFQTLLGNAAASTSV